MTDLERAGPSTRAVHAGEGPRGVHDPVVNPLVLSTTFISDPDGQGPLLYQRYGNAPNHVLVEARHLFEQGLSVSDRAQLEAAEANRRRQQQLLKLGLATQSDVDGAEEKLAELKAQKN